MEKSVMQSAEIVANLMFRMDVSVGCQNLWALVLHCKVTILLLLYGAIASSALILEVLLGTTYGIKFLIPT